MDDGVLQYVCYVVTYVEGFCKRDEKRYGDL